MTEMVDDPGAVVGKAHQGQRPLDSGGQVLPLCSQLLGTEGHVLGDGGTEQLVVGILENQTDLASDGSEVGAGDGLARYQHASIVGRLFGQEAIQVEEQGRLARPVGSHEADALAAADLEADPAQGLGAIVIAIAQVAHHYGGLHCHPRAHMAS